MDTKVRQVNAVGWNDESEPELEKKIGRVALLPEDAGHTYSTPAKVCTYSRPPLQKYMGSLANTFAGVLYLVMRPFGTYHRANTGETRDDICRRKGGEVYQGIKGKCKN